jgi:hypothetical protein
VGWLRCHRVLLPGVSVLVKQVASVRQVAEKRLYATVAGAARRADASLQADLVALLGVPERRRISELERLRRPPTRTTGASLAKALERVDEISAFRLGRVKLDKVPPNRLATLARVGLGSKAPILERTPEPKRTALLTAVVRHLEASAIDDASDLFSVLMQVKLISAARRATDRDWLAARPRMAKASRMLDGVFRLWSEQLDLITESGTDLAASAMWRALETEIGPREEVMAASALLGELIGPADEEAEAEMRRLLATRYNTVRPFLSLLGESPALGAASGGKRILEAVKRLPALARRKVKAKPLLPREIDAKLVPTAWKKAVYSNPDLPEGAVDRDAYAVCVLEQLFRALNRRDVFASPSNRWADPRARLLDGKQWEAVCEDVLHGLSLDDPVVEHLAGRVRALDAAWQLMAERLEEAGQDAKLSFEVQPNGRLKLNVDRLGALGESESLKWLEPDQLRRDTTCPSLVGGGAGSRRRPQNGWSLVRSVQDPERMPRRLMFVQLKTGYATDRGPSWIGWLDFSKTWSTAYFHGRTLRRAGGMFDANFYDVQTNEEFWVSGPKRDRTDTRYGPSNPEIEPEAVETYHAFLEGVPLPGRENG